MSAGWDILGRCETSASQLLSYPRQKRVRAWPITVKSRRNEKFAEGGCFGAPISNRLRVHKRARKGSCFANDLRSGSRMKFGAPVGGNNWAGRRTTFRLLIRPGTVSWLETELCSSYKWRRVAGGIRRRQTGLAPVSAWRLPGQRYLGER